MNETNCKGRGLSMSTKVILKIIKAIASFSMIILLVSCSGGGGGSGGKLSAENTSGLYSYLTTAHVDLTTSTPIEENMGFSYKYAEYDTDHLNKNHWEISTYGGYMSFTFEGPLYFSYHARHFEGDSICLINVYVNGDIYEVSQFIDFFWRWYNIPPTVFGPDTNTVRIELVADKNLWLDVATAQASPLLD